MPEAWRSLAVLSGLLCSNSLCGLGLWAFRHKVWGFHGFRFEGFRGLVCRGGVFRSSRV